MPPLMYSGKPGFEEAQAAAVVAAVGHAVGENVATKADLRALEQRMTVHTAGRFESLYRNLRAIAVSTIAVTVTLVKLIP